MARQFSSFIAFSSGSLTAGKAHRDQKQFLQKPMDILVATPDRLLHHLKHGHVFLGDVATCVIDEVDTMFDAGFEQSVREILTPLRMKRNPSRCVLVAATLTRDVSRLLYEEFPGHQDIRTHSMHRGVVGAQHVFVPVSPVQDKMELLEQVVRGDQARQRRVIVFCNSMDCARAVSHHLREVTIPVVSYHGGMPADLRTEHLAAFMEGGQGDAAGGQQPVLVCTDVAARGLNFTGQADHVVNFDFPLTSIDYIHRSGRTARAGATGRITSLVGKKQRTLAGRIKHALEHDYPLDSLSNFREVKAPWQALEREKARIREKSLHIMKRGLKGPTRIAVQRGDTATIRSLMKKVQIRTAKKI